jgi:hypothetical protein
MQNFEHKKWTQSIERIVDVLQANPNFAVLHFAFICFKFDLLVEIAVRS